MRQICTLITAHTNTPQRGNEAGGGKFCYLPRGTVLNGLCSCLSACSCISKSGEDKTTTCLKATAPKRAQRTCQMSLKYCPQTPRSACYRKRLPLSLHLWSSKSEGLTCKVVLVLRPERITDCYLNVAEWSISVFSSSPVCTVSAA